MKPAFALVVMAAHRCSRCGDEGHNVRNCRKQSGWYAQRCSACGEVGHNARNCAARRASAAGDHCPVCRGRGTLPCGRCMGSGRVASALRPPPAPFSAHALRRLHQPLARGVQRATPPPHVPPPRESRALSEKQREWARLARARTRLLRNNLTDGTEPLIGGESVFAARNGWLRTHEDDEESKCSRCLGLGYLCCLSCSD